MSSDFTPLLDNSIPWTAEKVGLLNELVKFFYNNPSNSNVH